MREVLCYLILSYLILSYLILSYFLLALSIGLELFATTMLKASDGFTRPLQTVACVLGYVGSFYTLTHVLKYIPLSVTYATWSGVGLVVTALISVLYYNYHNHIVR